MFNQAAEVEIQARLLIRQAVGKEGATGLVDAKQMLWHLGVGLQRVLRIITRSAPAFHWLLPVSKQHEHLWGGGQIPPFKQIVREHCEHLVNYKI